MNTPLMSHCTAERPGMSRRTEKPQSRSLFIPCSTVRRAAAKADTGLCFTCMRSQSFVSLSPVSRCVSPLRVSAAHWSEQRNFKVKRRLRVRWVAASGARWAGRARVKAGPRPPCANTHLLLRLSEGMQHIYCIIRVLGCFFRYLYNSNISKSFTRM